MPDTDYRSLLNGEPVEIELPSDYPIICCGCGLVHIFTFERAKGGKIILKLYRDEWETKRVRKERKKKGAK